MDCSDGVAERLCTVVGATAPYDVIDRLPRSNLCDLIEAMIGRLEQLDGDCDLAADEEIACENQGGAL